MAGVDYFDRRVRQWPPELPLNPLESAMEALLAGMYAFVKVYLMVPSLIMDGVYKLGPVVAPVLGLLLCCAFPFIALRDKPDA